MERNNFDEDIFEQGVVPIGDVPGFGDGGIGGEEEEADGVADDDGVLDALDRDDSLFDSKGRIIIALNADLDPFEITKIVRTKDTLVLNKNLYCFLCCLSLETSKQGTHA